MVLMDISVYVDQLRSDLHAAAAAGGDAVAQAAERLGGALEAAVNMTMLEALSDAAAEITSSLDGAVIDVRLKGRNPHFVVTVTDQASPFAEPAPPPPDGEDDLLTARITLRLPEGLKARAEEAAGRARQSLNTWLVEAIRTATNAPTSPRERRGSGQHLSGWAR
jgi:HicB family